jgi:GST-like protein
MPEARSAGGKRGAIMAPAVHTLYGAQGSGSAAVEAALELCGVRYRIVNAASWEPDSALDELLRVNPLRQIPTLSLPDGSVLTESAAILICLGLGFPASGLLPGEPAARQQTIRGLVFIAANCYAAISVIDYPERWCAEATAPMKERIRRGTRARLHRHWEMFADQFQPRAAFLDGEEPGALDLLAAVVSRWSGTRQHVRKARPAFAALLERIDGHARLTPVFARHWPGRA